MLWRLAQPILCGRTGLRFLLRRLPPCARPAGRGCVRCFSSTTPPRPHSRREPGTSHCTPRLQHRACVPSAPVAAPAPSTSTLAAILSWPNGVQGPRGPMAADPGHCFPATQVEKRLMLDPSCHSKVDWPSQRAPQQARTPRHHLVRGSCRVSCGRQAGFLLGTVEDVRSTHGWTRELQCLLLCIPTVQERTQEGTRVGRYQASFAALLLHCRPGASGMGAAGGGLGLVLPVSVGLGRRWGRPVCLYSRTACNPGRIPCQGRPTSRSVYLIVACLSCVSCLPPRPALAATSAIPANSWVEMNRPAGFNR